MTHDEADPQDEQRDADLVEELGVEFEPSRLKKFAEDPWPPTVFVLMLLGFGIVLLTPYSVWRVYNWLFVGMYLLWILVGVAIVMGINVWYTPTESRMKYGGLTNILIALVCGVLGTADTIVTIMGGHLFPGIETSLLYGTAMIVFFALYTLWLIQRTMTNPPE